MMDGNGLSRRRLLLTAALMAPMAVIGCSSEKQTDKPLLRADDPVARALGYFPDSSDVPTNHPLAAKHEVRQTCAGCIHAREFFSDGSGRCPKFPGRLIQSTGWCSLWTTG